MTASQKSPTEILEAQNDILEKILLHQIRASSALDELRKKQEELTAAQKSALAQPPPRLGQVKIIDFNMPFVALIGMLVKISVASIPASLIMVVVFVIVTGTLLFGLSLLGVGLNTLFNSLLR